MTRFAIPIVPTVTTAAAGAEAWLCDIWGVMHNGQAAFASAVAACRAFRASGGIVILVSNAPRPAAAVAKQLMAFDIDAACYDAILTSGDVTRLHLSRHLDTPMLHIGPARDHGIFEGLGLELAAADDAGLLLCSGLYDDTTETPETYRSTFAALVRRGVPMLCANPDVRVERGAQLIWCAGGLAALYAEMGGAVTYCGKPHAAIYEAAFDLIARRKGRPVPRETILAIGDGVHTDIEGAARMGLPSVYVQSAIHLPGIMTAQSLDKLFTPLGFRPTAAMTSLAV